MNGTWGLAIAYLNSNVHPSSDLFSFLCPTVPLVLNRYTQRLLRKSFDLWRQAATQTSLCVCVCNLFQRSQLIQHERPITPYFLLLEKSNHSNSIRIMKITFFQVEA